MLLDKKLLVETDCAESFVFRDVWRLLLVDFIAKLAGELVYQYSPGNYNLLIAVALLGRLFFFFYLLHTIGRLRQGYRLTGIGKEFSFAWLILAIVLYCISLPLFFYLGGLNHSLLAVVYSWFGLVYEAHLQTAVYYLLSEEIHTVSKLALLFFAVIGAPVLEELLFRGVIYQALRANFSMIFSALLSGLLFALFHFEIQTILPLAMLGLLLAVIREKSASLILVMIIHSLHNVFMLYKVYAGARTII